MFINVKTFHLQSNDSLRSLEYSTSHKKAYDKYYFSIIFLLSSIFSLLIVFSILTTDKIDISKSIFTFNARSSDNKLEILSSNDYGELSTSTLGYTWLSDGIIIEPYRLTSITISNPTDNCDYKFELSSDSITIHDLSDIYELKVTATIHGTFDLTVFEKCGDATTEYHKKVYVKHIRRELRSLTDVDRDEFLDALKTLYDVDTVAGQELYGENYRSLYYFLSVHVDAAGNPVCDEFHSGAGFLSNHVFLGNYLEQSLQAVNPKVALHYMEYVNDFDSDEYDLHLQNQLDGGNWSELFSSKYFGESDPLSGRIISGRWKESTVPYMTKSFLDKNLIDSDKTFFPNEENVWLTLSSAHLKSPFGLLRPPWNYNPSSYISRFNNEAGISAVTNLELSDFFIGTKCDDISDFLENNVIGQNLDSYLLNVKNSHTKVHDGIGGQGGENARNVDSYLISEYGFTTDDIIVFIQASSKFYKKYLPLKNYYSSTKYPVYPLLCSDNPWDENNEILRTTETPTCQCNDYYFESDDKLNTLVKIYFDKFAFESTIQYSTIEKIINYDFENKSIIMSKLCSRLGIDGDMVGSASAIDPIFWVSHGSVEKLYQKIVMNNLLTDLSYTAGSSSCSGHAPWGKKDWLDGYHFIDTNIEPKDFTNAQLSELLNPNSKSYRDLIPYVYDSLKSNCEEIENLFVK